MKEGLKEYVIQSEEPARCLCCGHVINYGRSDKKFCGQQCKDKFHNRSKSHKADAKMKFERAMERNYSILNDLVKLGISQIPMTELVTLGFKPEFMTSCMTSGRGQVFSCYDISYRLSPARAFNIHRIALTLQQIKSLK